MKPQTNYIDCLPCLWKNAWWFDESEPPEFSEDELGERDFAQEDLGVSPLVQQRFILIRGPWTIENGLKIPFDETWQDEREMRLGRVLKLGRHIFPPSNTLGKEGHQVLCREGDWVEYMYWQRTDSCIPKVGDVANVYYIQETDIISVINPKDYPIFLREYC